MNIKIITIALMSVLLLAACANDTQQEVPNGQDTTANNQNDILVNNQPTETGIVHEIRLTGHMFYFMDEDGTENPDIIVGRGDRVRIVFDNIEGMHDWVVDEMEGAQTSLLQPGESETIEFIATETGEYEYYCSYMRHREMGMYGRLIVE
ncbi:MAG: plastocyanin/azurin family copper-binding protein [Candidatus Woesearchaeota archaeon]